jgi:ribonuclease D
MTWVRTPEALQQLAERLADCKVLALDTESDGLHHHVAKLCLLQLAPDVGEAVLVDPLALRDLTPLRPVLGDPAVVKILHGADYDVLTLKRDLGFPLANLFDTMLAARFLGLRELGLQAVARAELGVELSKDSQKDDWSRRPLTPRQEAYALADVTHLALLRERLLPRLEEKGRLDWLLEECEAMAGLEPPSRERNPEAWMNLKGVRRLGRRQQAAARELYVWREGIAERTDIPAFKILGTEPLLAVASALPRTSAELLAIPGLSPRVRAQAAEALAAVERARALADDDLPVIPRTPRPVVPDVVRRREQALKAWRTAEAERLELDPSVLLPQRLLDPVAARPPRASDDLLAIEGFRRWRARAFGSAILDVLQRTS